MFLYEFCVNNRYTIKWQTKFRKNLPRVWIADKNDIRCLISKETDRETSNSITIRQIWWYQSSLSCKPLDCWHLKQNYEEALREHYKSTETTALQSHCCALFAAMWSNLILIPRELFHKRLGFIRVDTWTHKTRVTGPNRSNILCTKFHSNM
jgi:hypothetical protein